MTESLTVSASPSFTNLHHSRRRMVAALVGGALGVPAATRGQDKVPWRIGTIVDSSGVEKANGNGLHLGSSACFEAINRAGGVHGRRLELALTDDRFDPEASRRHALSFQSDPACIALLHPLGTRQSAAIIEAASLLPIVGPSTGTTALRAKSLPHVIWLRAHYGQEVEKLVGTAVAQGYKRIGVVHSKDALGESVLAACKASLARHGHEPAVVATTPATASLEVEPAAQAMARAAPQLVVMSLAGTAVAFVRALRRAGGNSTVYGLSIAASTSGIRELGDLARGLGFSVVVPSPFSQKHGVVRQYQADMRARGVTEFSLASLEGWIDARVLAEGLRRAGPGASRASLMAALEQIDQLDLGGFRIGFGPGKREGSQFVDVAVVGQGGRVLS
jgi:branched-chain amino acid transport system substrate-binding protein